MPKQKKPASTHNEYEIKDGCRIQQIRVTNGCRYYQVDLRNNAGKRIRKNFTNAKKACSFASKSMAKASGSGGGGIKALQSTDTQRDAVEILNPFNTSLRDAALFYAEYHEAVDYVNSTKALIEQFIVDYQNGLQHISEKQVQENSTTAKEAPLLASESTEKATDDEMETLQFPDTQYEALEILTPSNEMNHRVVDHADDAEASEEQLVKEEQIIAEAQLVTEEQLAEEEQFFAEQQLLIAEEQFLAEEQVVAEQQPLAEEQILEEEQFFAEQQRLAEEQFLEEKQVVAEEQVQTDRDELQPVSPVDTKDSLSLAWKPLYIPKNVKTQKIYTPSDARRIMRTAKTELLPYLALGMFGGLRSTEILKLRWRDVDFKLAEIQVNANQSIVNGRRTVSMQSNLGQFLVPFRGKPKEFVVPHKQENLQRWTRTLFKELEIKTINQGARHSFAMYHLASHPLDETMEELGYSESTPLHRYYRGLTNRRRAQAEKYFAIAPPNQADIIPIKKKAAA